MEGGHLCLMYRNVRMGVDRTGSGSCPVVGFGISRVEPPGSATAVLDLKNGDRL
jgi:hypothetical protein